jgi:hypothetical protein
VVVATLPEPVRIFNFAVFSKVELRDAIFGCTRAIPKSRKRLYGKTLELKRRVRSVRTGLVKLFAEVKAIKVAIAGA